MSEITELKHNKLFFMGCWNRLNNNNSNSCLKTVIYEIAHSDAIYGESYDFGVVLGDNIYPDETKYESDKNNKIKGQTKQFTKSKMETGIAMFEELNLPLHIVLGNHDVENCLMLDIQTKSDNLGNRWNFKSNLYSTLYKYGSHIIKLVVIDTNVLNEYNPSRQTHIDNDYKKLEASNCKISSNINSDGKSYYSMLDSILDPSNNSEVSLIIVAGHEPLITVKQGSDGKSKIVKMSFVNDFMEKVRLLKQQNIDVVYICADTHAYMDTIIHSQNKTQNKNVSIKQIVAGTGGSYPDIFNEDFIKSIKENSPVLIDEENTITVEISDVQNSYGYGVFDIEKHFTHGKSFTYRHKKENVAGSAKCFDELIGGQVNLKIYHDNKMNYLKLKSQS